MRRRAVSFGGEESHAGHSPKESLGSPRDAAEGGSGEKKGPWTDEEETLLANAQAVFRLEKIEGNKFLVKSNADHNGYNCMVFGGHGYDTNPRRMNWGNGDEYCGAGHWNGMSLKDAVLDSKQAVWLLNL